MTVKFAALVHAMKERGYGQLYQHLMGEPIERALW